MSNINDDGNDIMPDDNDNLQQGATHSGVVTLGQIDIDPKRFGATPDTEALPILPTRNLVLFPGVTVPIALGRKQAVATATAANEKSIPIGIVCQTDEGCENPTVMSDLMEYGVVADVLKVFTLPDGNRTAIVRARDKIRLLDINPESVAIPGAISAKVKLIHEPVPRAGDIEFGCVAAEVRDTAIDAIRRLSGDGSEMMFNIENSVSAVETINIIATNAPVSPAEKQELLRFFRIKDRAFALLAKLSYQSEMATILDDIRKRTEQNISKSQREAFLSHHLEAIRKELYGDADDDASKLKKAAEKVDWTPEGRAAFDSEWEKLNRLAPQTPEYAVCRSYLELLTELPWNKRDPLTTDLPAARAILDSDHYGLERVKERIVEQLAVLMNTPDGRAPIICLVGAPGVGKTSLGQSIARALGRKYQRVSLGGLHDEAELRGHRRTYIGAMPGRIIEALRRAGTSNPVLLLDEIDKMGSDYKGDPSAAMLEVLDPEQNCRFHDNYVDADFDLSKVLFIATANSLSPIPQPLLDRMEVIDISGYLAEEKIEIGRRHLIGRLRHEHNLTDEEFDITPDAIASVIENYTSESGVRQLEKKLAAIARKVVVAKVAGEEWPHEVRPEHLRRLLGVETFTRDRYEGNDYPGVVMGLAWTSAGGEILYIEASATIAKSEKLTLTGNLGDVMKESAMIALQYVRAHARRFGIDPEIMERLALHLHVPEGAIPKDGPSAGITMATAIVSALTRRKVMPRVAMTGEITLRGRVLPVGGIKEKILAAKRAGATDIILSEQNRKNVGEIPEVYLEGLTFHYVKDVEDVIDIALTDETAGEPLTLPDDRSK